MSNQKFYRNIQEVIRNFWNMLCRLKSPQQSLKSNSQFTEKNKTRVTEKRSKDETFKHPDKKDYGCKGEVSDWFQNNSEKHSIHSWRNIYRFSRKECDWWIFYQAGVLVTQPCPTLCDPLECSPPGSSVHGILQARILEWVAISFSSQAKVSFKYKKIQ